MATIKAKENTAAATTYAAYDHSPVPGISYYRLQQFDVDGKFSFSGIQSLKIPIANGFTVAILPNPATQNISFSVGNRNAARVEVLLSDASGKIIYKEIFLNVLANASHQSNLWHLPTPGIYLLRLNSS